MMVMMVMMVMMYHYDGDDDEFVGNKETSCLHYWNFMLLFCIYGTLFCFPCGVYFVLSRALHLV